MAKLKFPELEVVLPHVELITPKYNPDWYNQALLLIEECARVSHKSEKRIKKGSAEPFIRKIGITYGHESVMEHACFTACFIGSRSFSHQLVRHRVGSIYTQESQRYCDYGKLQRLKVIPHQSLTRRYKTGDIISIDQGSWIRHNNNSIEDEDYGFWYSCITDYKTYLDARKNGIKAEDARESLPNACKTEVYTTFNMRQWRHFFKMRMDKHAQKQIQILTREVFNYFKKNAPLFVENLTSHSGDPLI